MKLHRNMIILLTAICLMGGAASIKGFNPLIDEGSESIKGFNPLIDKVGQSKVDAPVKWVKGKELTEAQVQKAGMANLFEVVEIDEATFARMQKGGSFPANCTIKRADLRYLKLLHYDFAGKIICGEMVCNKLIAQDVRSVFMDLFKIKYPIQKMVLIDDFNANDIASMSANNTSSFCFRMVAGTTKLSKHARGLAVDINPETNPYVKYNASGKAIRVSPDTETARKCADRSSAQKHMVKKGDACYNIFIKHGFTWGGNWKSSKDWQHFEKRL